MDPHVGQSPPQDDGLKFLSPSPNLPFSGGGFKGKCPQGGGEKEVIYIGKGICRFV